MPIFDYCCSNCGFALEILHKVDEPVTVACPACHEHALQKQIGAVSVRFSGTGYYETDDKPKDKQRHIKQSDNVGAE